MPVSLPVHVKQLVSQWVNFAIFYVEKFYHTSVEKIQIGLILDKNIKHLVQYFIVTRRNAVR